MILNFIRDKRANTHHRITQRCRQLLKELLVNTHACTPFDQYRSISRLHIFPLTPPNTPELTTDQACIIGGQTFIDLTIRCLDEAIRINLSIGCQITNQTDVRTFRRLDGTDTAIVGLVHVTHIETCTLTRKTTRTQSRKTALVTNLSQCIGLVHELGELATTKELLHGCDHWTNIDQRIRRSLTRLLNAHALLHHTLHTQQTNTELRLDQLTNTTYTAIAQMVNIVFTSTSIVKHNQTTNNIDQIILRQNALILRNSQI